MFHVSFSATDKTIQSLLTCFGDTDTKKSFWQALENETRSQTWAWAVLAFQLAQKAGRLWHGRIKAAPQTLAPHCVSLPLPQVRRHLHFVRFATSCPTTTRPPGSCASSGHQAVASSSLVPEWWRTRLGLWQQQICLPPLVVLSSGTLVWAATSSSSAPTPDLTLTTTDRAPSPRLHLVLGLQRRVALLAHLLLGFDDPTVPRFEEACSQKFKR
jgi:hypothetical protein